MKLKIIFLLCALIICFQMYSQTLSVTVSTTSEWHGWANGSATANPSGGTPPYTYMWNYGSTQTIINLGAGIYCVTVTDAVDDTATACGTVEYRYGLYGFVTIGNATNGQANGWATATITNPYSPPLTYEWGTLPPQYTDTAWNLASGYYNVKITSQCGCYFDTIFYVNNVNGIMDYTPQNTLAVFPNPATSKLFIKAPPKTKIEIFNTEGQCILKTTSEDDHTNIDISDLAPGMYFIKAGSATGKFVKE